MPSAFSKSEFTIHVHVSFSNVIKHEVCSWQFKSIAKVALMCSYLSHPFQTSHKKYMLSQEFHAHGVVTISGGTVAIDKLNCQYTV